MQTGRDHDWCKMMQTSNYSNCCWSIGGDKNRLTSMPSKPHYDDNKVSIRILLGKFGKTSTDPHDKISNESISNIYKQGLRKTTIGKAYSNTKMLFDHSTCISVHLLRISESCIGEPATRHGLHYWWEGNGWCKTEPDHTELIVGATHTLCEGCSTVLGSLLQFHIANKQQELLVVVS